MKDLHIPPFFFSYENSTLDRHVSYVSQTRTHLQSLEAQKTLAFSASSGHSDAVCTTGELSPSIVDAARRCFCVTFRTVAQNVSSEVVNALDPTVETPIITVELHIAPADDSGVPVPVLAVAGDWT